MTGVSFDFSPACSNDPPAKKKAIRRRQNSLIAHLIDAAKAAGCYKVILDCAERKVGYYEKCGLARKEVQMARYFL